jgi:hypothetical protein
VWLSKGPKGDKGDRGEPGKPGGTGLQGTQGVSIAAAAATVTSVASNTAPSVKASLTSITGSTDKKLNLDFWIPKGERGPQGLSRQIEVKSAKIVTTEDPKGAPTVAITPTNSTTSNLTELDFVFGFPAAVTGGLDSSGKPSGTITATTVSTDDEKFSANMTQNTTGGYLLTLYVPDYVNIVSEKVKKGSVNASDVAFPKTSGAKILDTGMYAGFGIGEDIVSGVKTVDAEKSFCVEFPTDKNAPGLTFNKSGLSIGGKRVVTSVNGKYASSTGDVSTIPVKGTDYFTKTEIDEVTREVITALETKIIEAKW